MTINLIHDGELSGLGGKAWPLPGLVRMDGHHVTHGGAGVVAEPWLLRVPGHRLDFALTCARLLMVTEQQPGGRYKVMLLQLEIPGDWGPGRVQQACVARPYDHVMLPPLMAVPMVNNLPDARGKLQQLQRWLAEAVAHGQWLVQQPRPGSLLTMVKAGLEQLPPGGRA